MPVPVSSASLSRVCLRDAAYVRLRDWIIDGTLQPDEPLRDETLAEALGMSRTPIREALQRLEDDGLVVTTPTRRTHVSPITLTQAREIFPIVAALETFAVRLALPHLDDDILSAMRSANAQLANALTLGDAGAALAADGALHSAFITKSGNSELITLLEESKSKVRRIERAFWGSADRSASLRDHDELLAALSERNLSAAQRVLTRNWQRGLDWLNPEFSARP